jgi:DNA polymerase-3 subunit alpha (Gram-positive type)
MIDVYHNDKMNLDINGIKKIVKIDTPEYAKYSDFADKPRIEICAHTKFTSFDGLDKPESVVERAANFKAPYVGICDRGNVQSYPSFYAAAKKVKPIYGYECAIQDRIIEQVVNVPEKTVDIRGTEYVVFDIETTGLQPDFCDMIEFGAVKVKDGNIIDRLDVFSKPTKPLSEFTKSLTHITDEMVDKAEPFQVVIKKIKD